MYVYRTRFRAAGGFDELLVVDASGTVVWEYLCPVTARGVQTVLSDNDPMTNAVPRAYRYAATHPALTGHDLSPDGTLSERATVAFFPWLGHVPGRTTVGLGFANPGESAVTVTVTGSDGTTIRDFGTFPVPAFGGLHLDVAPPFEGSLRLTSTGRIVATALVRDGDESLSVLNLIPATRAASRLYAAHLTRYGSLFDTEVNLVNPGAAEAVVTLTPFGADGTVSGVDYYTGVAVVNPSTTSVTVTLQVRFSDGTPNGNSVTRTLGAGEKYVRLLSQMEGVGTLAAQASGSLEISASGPVLAFALFGDTAGRFLSAVPAQ